MLKSQHIPGLNKKQIEDEKRRKRLILASIATKFREINKRKREQRRRLSKNFWTKYAITITFTRRNTFVNVGYTERIPRLRLTHKQRKIKNSRGLFTKTITYVSAGLCGLKGSKKAAPMANITIGERVAVKLKKFGNKYIRGRFFGSGRRRREIMKGLVRNGVVLRELKQETKRAHNGVRHKKPRRK